MITYAEWLHAQRKHFLEGDYTLREVIEVSLACGWNRRDMTKSLRHWPRGLWVMDPESGAGRAAKMDVDSRIEGHLRTQCLSLQDQWRSVRDYQSGGPR